MLASAALGVRARGAAFAPNWDSLKTHKVPAWFEDAKLGIFLHWGLYSVPAWAPPSGQFGKIDWNKWFLSNPYAEWYLNGVRLVGSATYKHHVETYGKDFDYYRFSSDFNRATAKWDPGKWADLFRKTGARYAVLTTKHHDGFRLWPSKIANPRRGGAEITASRDLVGDLTRAVRGAGMKMGLYYSGGVDWTFTDRPVRNLDDMIALLPQGDDYARYVDAQWTELIDRYQPSLLWNDINYPKKANLPGVVAHYYNSIPDGAINNRFGVDFYDFTTPEYSKYDKVVAKKWESCRGLGFSFGYNRNEGPHEVIGAPDLIWMLVDIVSKNGNLLLNVGPRADGSIPDIQMDRLNKLGDWIAVHGEGIFSTRPWAAGTESAVRYTRKGDAVYAFFEKAPPETLVLPGVTASPATKIRVLGHNQDSVWQQRGKDLAVQTRGLGTTLPIGLRITPAPAR